MRNDRPYTSRKLYATEDDAGSRFSRLKWPFRLMEVGDFISVLDPANNSAATACSRYAAERYSMKFQRKTIAGVLHIKRIS